MTDEIEEEESPDDIDIVFCEDCGGCDDDKCIGRCDCPKSS